jgi:hypothetical protein
MLTVLKKLARDVRRHNLKPKAVYVINPMDKGYVVDYYEEGKLKHSAHSTRDKAFNFFKHRTPANHQVILTDMGEMKDV